MVYNVGKLWEKINKKRLKIVKIQETAFCLFSSITICRSLCFD